MTVGTLTSAQYTATYSYDPLNRITGGSLGTMTYGDAAHLHAATSSTSGETASYDAAGEMTCRAPTSATTCAGGSPTGASLTYDAERRLKYWQNGQNGQPITSQVWMLYDGAGNRVEQYVSGGSGNHTYYLPGNAEEVTPSNTLVKYYAAGGLSLGLNTTTNGSGISYLVSDGLGSVSEALNQTGTATGGVLYGPYGGVRYSTGTLPTAKGFTGQYSDASTGLDYYGARYYDPQLGQFTSADTVADGLNRYGYVKGNPETATDPTGHRTDDGFHDGGSSSGEINEADWVWHTRTGGEQFNMRQQIAACRADPTGCDLWSAAAFNYTPFDNRRWNEARHMWGLDDPEWDAAIGLENYFGLQIMLNSQSPAKGSGGGTNPDYTMGIATMVATPGTWPGVGMAIKYGTNLELYTPTGDNEGNIIAEIGRKGADYGKKAQAPIVVVDVDKSSVFNGMDSNALTTWGSTKIGSKGPYRIIFMRNNTVVADVGNWGPDAYGRGDIA